MMWFLFNIENDNPVLTKKSDQPFRGEIEHWNLDQIYIKAESESIAKTKAFNLLLHLYP